MGIFGAMTTAISGINAQAYALEHISDNIANSQTTGFKRTETVFADLVFDSQPQRQRGGSVQGLSRATNTVGGDIKPSDVATHMAINGDGYFIVEESSGTADGKPLFANVSQYTRRGDFELDRNGFLVNSSGYYLKGLAIDPVTGNPAGGSPSIVTVTNDFLPAKITTTIDYKANLASYPLTANSDPSVADSEKLLAADFVIDPTTGGAGTVNGTETSTFINRTIAGGAVTAFDAVGSPVNVQFRWGKISSDTWNLFYQTDPNATGATIAWQNIGTDYVFDTAGKLSPAINTTTITALTVSGNNLGNITLDHGSNAITSFADPNGVAKVNELEQNGYASGELAGVVVSEGGRIVGSYTNGETLELYEVTLASFNADSALKKLDGGAFGATRESGSAILGAQGSILASRLEGSNSDIASEFSKLIVTQQAYAAGTRIVTTADQMIQEILNMKR
ncbi:Flagellar hook protein FlgE [hydrothermal vent metagenome]|uniref:Flagellar hook protein FlgE n=1 Tax=hydrothermal vent metagenome TaxID=652676 RepID=A0A3B0T0P3_9ZZZZ